MANENKFNISIDRVEKLPVPLLVVGLGGTGCDALLTVKETFAERYILPKDAVEGGTPEEFKKYMEKKCAKHFLHYEL